jgi:GH15 family glucan-1,4-alpha-glucosidase
VTDQPAIESYGLLGDTRTAALVSEDGSIDWMCVPRFDGEPVFGRLIDPRNGGKWILRPTGARVVERSYSEDATSIRTRWTGPAGEFLVTEGMPADATSRLLPRSIVVRRIHCLHGEGDVESIFDPRYGLPGRAADRVTTHGEMTICDWGAFAVGLTSDRPAAFRPAEPSSVSMGAGQSATFVMSVAFREPVIAVAPSVAYSLVEDTDQWWRSWVRRFSYEGEHRSAVRRGLITLRLLTYAPSGAPVAAPTTSLPAPIGADQNWDYRFSWPRDASIGVNAFLDLGSDEEPRAFLDWLVNASRITRPRLEVLYDLDGRPLRREREVPSVAGYLGSTPVRIGNAASLQHQLDVYGWVLDAAWCMHEAGHRLTRDQWRAMVAFADLLAERWPEPDNGLWEQRSSPRHFVHSKMMAWRGLDRGLELARYYPTRGRDVRWQRELDRCRNEIRVRGFDQERQAYLRAYDSTELDASVLGPLTDFEPEGSPRIAGTIQAIRRELGASDSLLYRYHHEDRAEGAFLPCSFWLVRSLARSGFVDDAENLFDRLCGLASPLGLYAEQIDPGTGGHLGNFPQAFSHATFLQAVAALSAAQETRPRSSRTERARPA